jgi:RNA polymerase sigma factor (sigma-70 family)
MAEALPPELSALLLADGDAEREAAWARFIAMHSGLLLQAARTLGRDYDAAMDRYAYALERLQEREFHRLRAYQPDGRTKFTTWLLVVFRRLCLDHYRRRYGRSPSSESGGAGPNDRVVRRRLVDGLAEQVDPELLAAPSRFSPEDQLSSRHRQQCLTAALAALEPEDRLLLQFRYEEDLSAREIAKLVGMPSQFHVYRRLNALCASLRRALLTAGIEGSEA